MAPRPARGLVTLFVVMIMRGRLITLRAHLEIVALLKERLTERDEAIKERDARILKLEKERDDALSLATTATETVNIQARIKDASLVAVEAVRDATAPQGGGDP